MYLWIILATFLSAVSNGIALNCAGERELSLVWDVSSTVVNEQDVIKQFIKTFAQDLPLGMNSKIAVATFSNYAMKQIFCEDHDSTASFNAAIDDIGTFGFLTNIEDALRKGEELLNERGCDLKKAAKSVLVLITDGLGNVGSRASTMATARAVRKKGIMIFTIGIGISMRRREALEELSGGSQFVETFDSFTTLANSRLYQLLERIPCPSTQESPSTPVTTTSRPTISTTSTSSQTPVMDPFNQECSCTLDEDVFASMRSDINKKSEGLCVVEKLRLSLMLLDSTINSLEGNLTKIMECQRERKATYTRLILARYPGEEMYFDMLKECIVNYACKGRRLLTQLRLQKDVMENELRIELEGYVDYAMAGRQTALGMHNKYL